MKYKPCSTTCSTKGCEAERRPGQRNCVACHAAEARAYRKRRTAKMSEFRQIAERIKAFQESR